MTPKLLGIPPNFGLAGALLKNPCPFHAADTDTQPLMAIARHIGPPPQHAGNPVESAPQ
jgi:hypothetical protein